MASRRIAGAAIIASVLSLGASVHADVVIGDWENTADGWIDWGAQTVPIAAPKYTYSDVGVTRGTTSLKLTHAGWNQNLSIKLQNNGLRDEFVAHQKFSIDVTVPGSEVGGFAEVVTLGINAQSYGFTNQNEGLKRFYGFPDGNSHTETLTWDYSALVDGNAANGEIPETDGWIELVLATNSDAAHGVFYFDNARLTKPGMIGDFNDNQALDVADIELLLHAQNGAAAPANAIYDVNADNQVVTAPGAAGSDSDHWVQTLVGTRYGDANLDKRVNFADLVVLAQNYNKPTGATWAMGSFNGDGAVNFADLVALAQNYNFVGAPALSGVDGISASFAADWALAQSLVPEPTSLAALLVASSALARRRRA